MKTERVDDASNWRQALSPQFIFRFRPGSPAEENIEYIQLRAQAIRNELAALLTPGTLDRQFYIYLSERKRSRRGRSPGNTADPCLEYRDGLSDEELKRAFVTLLLEQTLGKCAGQATWLIDGMLGYLAVKGDVPDPVRFENLRLQVLQLAKQVALADYIKPTSSVKPPHDQAVATSFVDFLVTRSGVEKLTELLRAWDPTAPDRTFQAVYAKSMTDLEIEWRAHLRVSRMPAKSIRWVLRRSLSYWFPYWKMGLLIIGLLLVQEGFSTFMDLSLQSIVDDALTPKNFDLLVTIVEQLAGAFALAAVAAMIGNYFGAKVAARILNDMRRAMFQHLQRLSMNFYSHARTGDIVANFTSDLAEVEKGVTARLTDGSLALAVLALRVPLMFMLEWRLALACLVVLPVVSLGGRFLAAPAARAYYRLKKEHGQVASIVQENIRGQSVVKIFGLQTFLNSRFEQELQDLYRLAVKATFLTYMVGTTSALSVGLVQLFTISLGAYFAFKNYMTVGALIAFIALLNDVALATYNLSKKVVPSLIAAAAGMQRIDNLLDTVPQIVDAPEAKPLPPFSKEIRFEDVSFRYTRQQQVLDHLSFTIPAGQYVAFVGPSGAGKSSLLSLMARFYDVTEGAVCVDGYDVRSITQESLTASFAAVFQDTFLFNTSIRENIRLGRLDATDAEIEAAARAAEIHEVIRSLPRGYDTTTGEMGGLLSGGQRQRLAIARAILRNPSVLLLDEPTSDLDATTEAAINATLERLAKNRTVVAVTHRLAAVQNADRIFVLDHGRLVEQGRHVELLKQKGLYYQLWQKQNGMLVSDDGEQARVTANYLRAIPLFAHLDENRLNAMSGQFVSAHYDAGHTVVESGRPGDRFFVLVRGRAEVIPAGSNGHGHPVALLEDGDYFGEMALYDRALPQVTLRTLQPSLFLVLRRSQFLSLMEIAPELRTAVAPVASRRLDLLIQAG